MVEISKHIPEWTDKDMAIIKEYERRKKEGTIKEYVLIKKDDIEETIKERLSQAFSKSMPFSNIIRPSSKKNE